MEMMTVVMVGEAKAKLYDTNTDTPPSDFI